jgi:raffinose/stachyose/melibiose transport system substrate-binding protein
MKKKFGLVLVLALMLITLLPATGTSARAGVTLTIESWRNDDLPIWEDVLIPAFNAHYPDINVVFAPTPPAEYNAVLSTKLEGGTAGDLITCRPFDNSLLLFQQGNLVSLNDLPGMEHFGPVAKGPWSTDDGSDVFCVPMASVIHGFLYNTAIFDELGLSEPTSEEEFMALLQTIKDDGNYAPLVMGTKDMWEAATMGFQNIGPNYWKGEEGRLGLIAGTVGYNEDGFLQAFEELDKWPPYLPEGYQALSYPDAQNLFASVEGGAIYPAGSWDISTFEQMNPDLKMGAFRPQPPAGQADCYISDHVDIAMGINAASPNQDAAKTFLEWMTTQEFANLYSNALPGFYSLSDHDITVDDPIAQEFVSWRGECQTTIRSSYQILSRNPDINNENDLWQYNAQMLNGDITAQEAADTVEERLASWYEPQKEHLNK